MNKAWFFKALGIKSESKLTVAITLALLVFIVATLFVNWYVTTIDFLHINQKQSYIHHVSALIRDIALWSAAALAVIFTLIKYPNGTKNWVAKLRLIFSIGAMLAWSLGLLYAHNQMANINGMQIKLTDKNPQIVQEFENFVRTTDMDKSELETISIHFAKSIYRENGNTTTVYLTESGLNEYVPTDEDIKQRQEFIQADKLLKHMVNGFYSGSITTFLVLLLAVSVGLIYNKYKLNRWL